MSRTSTNPSFRKRAEALGTTAWEAVSPRPWKAISMGSSSLVVDAKGKRVARVLKAQDAEFIVREANKAYNLSRFFATAQLGEFREDNAVRIMAPVVSYKDF